MHNITDSITKHLPSIVPNSFMLLEDDYLKEVITGLLGDQEGTIWLIEMSRQTGKINPHTRKKIGECQ